MTMSKAAHLVLKIFYRILEVCVALTLVLTILGIIRLASGPIEVKSLTPILVDILTPEDTDLTVEIESAYIELGFKRGRLLDIKATHLALLRPDNSVMASVPEANISLNPLRLMTGDFVPSSIYMKQPYLQIEIGKTNGRAYDERSLSDAIAKGMHYALGHMEQLRHFEIEKGELVFDFIKLDQSILVPELNVEISSQGPRELDVQLYANVYVDGTFMPLWMKGLYERESQTLTFENNFKDLTLSKFSFLMPLLEGIHAELDGQITGQFKLGDIDQGARFIADRLAFTASADTPSSIYLPVPLDTTYYIQTMQLNGSFEPHLEGLNIRRSTLSMKGPSAELEATITGLGTYLDTNDLTAIESTMTSTVRNVSIQQVPDVWPSLLGPDAHAWVKENITAGTVDTAHFILHFKGQELTEVKGLLNVSDGVVRYLEGMPEVTQVTANVILQLGRVDIDVLSGRTGNLILNHALLHFTDLLTDTELADMELSAEGPIQEALELIALPPLDLAGTFEIDPKTVSGTASADVTLHFPLKETLTAQEVDVTVQAELTQASADVPKTPLKLSEGQLNLHVDNNGLNLAGTALLDNIPVHLKWEENFIQTKRFVSRYTLNGSLTASSFMPYFPKIDRYFKGGMPVKAVFTFLENNTMTVSAIGQLKETELRIPLGYTKDIQVPGTVTLEAVQTPKAFQIKALSLDIPQDNVSVKGKAEFKDKTVFAFDTIQLPKNDAAITFEKNKDGSVLIQVAGEMLNISEILHGPEMRRTRTPEEIEQMKPTDFKLQARLARLYLSDKTPLQDVNIDVQKENDRWTLFSGQATAAEPIIFNLNQAKTELVVQTDDIGSFLAQGGYTERIQGGQLRTTLKQTPEGALTGIINIYDFRLTQTSFLTQAMTILGILDAFRGDFIPFKKATIPFTLTPENVVIINEAVASGSSLGITFRGSLSGEKIDMQGSIVPAYAINSLPGKIPLIGRLFSGEEGGGLFGVSFEAIGTPDHPQVNINPATLFAPGIIRRIFQ